MKLYLPRHHFEKIPERMRKRLEILGKSLLLLGIPIPFAAVVSIFWYYFIFRRHLHFSEKMEAIVTAAWIPIFGILYSLLAATVVTTVWNEYKSIRTAVKKYDFDSFIDLRDEEMSPLIYVLIGAISMLVLASFMSLKYPEWQGGVIVIGSTAYVLCLLFLVVREIDDPCAGFWYIRNIPPEWLTINPKEWRKSRQSGARLEFNETCKKFNVNKNGSVTTTALVSKTVITETTTPSQRS